MTIYPAEKTALFIDGANLYATAKTLGFEIDYNRLRAQYIKRCHLTRAYYYTVLSDNQEYSSIRPLVDWLDYNGYKVVTKPLKEYNDAAGRRKFKGNIDIELAVDALQMADSLDHYILFTGDGDFRCLVEALQQKGKRVSIVSSLVSQPPMIADELRRQADEFIELADIEDDICRQDCKHDSKQDWQNSLEDISYLNNSDY